jgi:hypothetical protein
MKIELFILPLNNNDHIFWRLIGIFDAIDSMMIHLQYFPILNFDLIDLELPLRNALASIEHS